MLSTLKLDSSTWDLTLDGLNNIAIQTESYAVIQDVSSAVLTYQGEVWFDTTIGVPYFDQILGKPLNAPLFGAYYDQAALLVPDVVKATTSFAQLGTSRKLDGTVKVIDTKGQSLNATF